MLVGDPGGPLPQGGPIPLWDGHAGERIVAALGRRGVSRIYLPSRPWEAEEGYAREAFATNWLSTVGPNLTAFEESFAIDRASGRGAW